MTEFPLHWIPLFPLLGAAFNILFGRTLSRRVVHIVACGSVFAAFIVALNAVSTVYSLHGSDGVTPALTQTIFDWIGVGGVAGQKALDIKFGFLCDPLSGLMILVITFVGFLIHLYSTEYMGHDKHYGRYFGYLNLFTASMLILVLGDNLAVMFVGWEGVGLCSYLLIGFWFDKNGTSEPGEANANAGKKAFIVNRVGDFAFILGMFILFASLGTLNFHELSAQAPSLLANFAGLPNLSIATVAALLLFIGATGKSAQIPLYVWLPDAMAGPTPVSALIHAATMVTAGIYMIARLNFVYMLSPMVMGIIAIIGALTAVFAATIGLVQNDIKKVLAYSTVSQLGYMFLGVGVGAFSAGVFHVFTHAFFKACLFLGAGAVIHAMHDEQDIRKMGGLGKKLPITRWTFLISCLAIAGIAPFSGFWSKDEILWKALSTANPAWPGWFPQVLYLLGIAGAFCTSFYMFRLYYLTFSGTCRACADVQHHIHAPHFPMHIPLVVLSAGAALLGFLGMPWHNLFHHWLAPVVDVGKKIAADRGIPSVAENALAHNHTVEYGLMAASVGIAVVAWLWARSRYGRDEIPTRAPQGALHTLLLNKYWIDELYDWSIVRPVKAIASMLYRVVDAIVIDGIVNVVGFFTKGVGWLAQRFQTGRVQDYVLIPLMVAAAVLLGLWIKGTAPAVESQKNASIETSSTTIISSRVHPRGAP